MPIPDLTNLQFLILACLMSDEQPGRTLRALLREEEQKKKERSGPGFYMLMARMEEADFVEGRYERKEVDGYEIKERLYEITQKGIEAFDHYREFAMRHGGLEPIRTETRPISPEQYHA